MADLDINVAPDLHPDTFLSLDGVDNETAPLIAPAIEAFDAAYQYISGIHQIRKAAFADPTLTPEGGLVLREMMKAVGGLPVTDQRTGRVVREDGPQAIRAKRDASAAIYAKHA